MGNKFRAHETFYIRKGWLGKGMRYVSTRANLFSDKENSPMDVLGIGSNMVKSLRYWLQAVGLTIETKGQVLTEFGNLVYEHDPYTEEIGTLQLLHYKLVSNRDLAPSWYFFFNIFSMREFTKDDFLLHIQNELKLADISVALRSLTDDFACIVNTYVPRYKYESSKISPENNMSCPLGELELLDIFSKERGVITYKKTVPNARTFNPWVVLAVISDQACGRNEIGLNELLTSEMNIGKIYNLDSICMLEMLHDVERLGEIKIIRTAGLDIIKIKNKRSFAECVENYYASIEGTVRYGQND